MSLSIKQKFYLRISGLFLSAQLFLSVSVFSQEGSVAGAEELAKKLANPVSSLISVPFQNNTDVGIGTLNGTRNTLNIQPVIPFALNTKVNLITRVILPIVSQHDITGAGQEQRGLGDVLASAFFSPSNSKNGLIWGAGPVLLMPLATNEFLGTKKWGAGPTAVLLAQRSGWTYGALVNQVWSFAGSSTRSDISQFFFQPFFNYNWKSGSGLGVSAEYTHNWVNATDALVVVPSVSGVIKLGKQIVSLSGGPRLHVSGPSKPDIGFRAGFSLVFPK
jgi:hypothetical protein